MNKEVYDMIKGNDGMLEYWFSVTGLERWQILMFCIIFELYRIFHISAARYVIETGFKGWQLHAFSP